MATEKRNNSEDMQNEKSGVIMIDDVDNMSGLDTIEDTKPGAFVWLCAAATAIGGMLFGCKSFHQSTTIAVADEILPYRRYRCYFRRPSRTRNRSGRQRSNGL